MRIQHRERRLFALERIDTVKQDSMLEDVGMIAGMEGVAIVHASGLTGESVMAKVLGVGGLFFKSRDGDAMRDWYGRVLGITFAGEPDLGQQARVDWNGMINVPTLSSEGNAEIRAAGSSPSALASRLSSYAVDNKILVKARAQVQVIEYVSLAYSVLGQVAQPGRYNFPRGVEPRLTVEEAIALAGGYTRLARQSKVLLKRGSQVYALDLKKHATQPDQQPIVIIPGDVITVSERMF